MEHKMPFEGIKVVDFSLGAVGTLTTKYLADSGASVVRIETRLRPDICRMFGPWRENIREPDHCSFYTNYNTSKYFLALNLGLAKAREIAWNLIMWADVVGEAFVPGVMKKWGFDYESISKVKPEIVYFSTCQQGQYGPHKNFRGFGPNSTAVSGFNHMTGWPDREPGAIFGAYTDYITPRFAAASLIAALDYKRKTGKGQYIDISQMECGVEFLAPVVMDYFVNNRNQTRNGNAVPNAAPHAAYQCQGANRWVNIVVTNDKEWENFCKVIGDPDWTKDSKFQTHLSRKANEGELNRLVQEWTIGQTAEEVMARMQEAGVPSGVVENYEDSFKNPQMMHRGHWVVMDQHPVIGRITHDGPAFKMSKTPVELRWESGVYGQHTEYICKEILGMTDDVISDLMAEGVFE